MDGIPNLPRMSTKNPVGIEAVQDDPKKRGEGHLLDRTVYPPLQIFAS